MCSVPGSKKKTTARHHDTELYGVPSNEKKDAGSAAEDGDTGVPAAAAAVDGRTDIVAADTWSGFARTPLPSAVVRSVLRLVPDEAFS